jgi:hypothetical protein
MERLQDRQAAESLQMRMDWKYALQLPLTYDEFNYSVLSVFLFHQTLLSVRAVRASDGIG